MKYKVKNLTLTCSAFPSQWEGRTMDDKYIYIRYRRGAFTATVADMEDDAVLQGVNSDSIYWESPSDEWGGEMSLEQMMKITTISQFFDFTECEFLEDNIKFYCYEISSQQITEVLPAFSVDSGKLITVEKDDVISQVTADKEKYITDPNAKVIDI